MLYSHESQQPYDQGHQYIGGHGDQPQQFHGL